MAFTYRVRSYLFAVVVLAASVTGAPSIASTELAWHSTLPSALAEARATDRYILVDLYADWCSWCKKLESDVFPTPAFSKRASNLALLKVDTEDGGEGESIKERYGVSTLPTTLLLNAEETLVGMIVGYAEADKLIAEIDRKIVEWETLLSRATVLTAEDDYEELRTTAFDLHKRRDGKRAATLYGFLLETETDPGSIAWLLYRQADAYRIGLDFTKAAELAGRAKGALHGASSSPQDTGDLSERLALLGTRIAHDQGQCDQAIAGLEEFLELHPESSLRQYAATTLYALRSGDAACG